MYCCVICHANLENESIAAVKCGHTFHLNCLRRWNTTSKSNTCPTCRFVIKNFDTEVFPHLYFEKLGDSSSETLDDEFNSELHKGIVEKLAQKENIVNRTQKELEKAKEEISNLRRKNGDIQESMKILRDKCRNYDSLNENLAEMSNKYKESKSQLQKYKNLSKLTFGSVEDVKDIFENVNNLEDLKQITTGFKNNFDKTSKRLAETSDNFAKTRKQLDAAVKETESLKKTVKIMKNEIFLLQKKPGQTPFNSALKPILIDTPDSPPAAASKTSKNDSNPPTPVKGKRTFTKMASVVEKENSSNCNKPPVNPFAAKKTRKETTVSRLEPGKIKKTPSATTFDKKSSKASLFLPKRSNSSHDLIVLD